MCKIGTFLTRQSDLKKVVVLVVVKFVVVMVMLIMTILKMKYVEKRNTYLILGNQSSLESIQASCFLIGRTEVCDFLRVT